MRRIKYSLGKTINLGNFQSARVDVGMEKDIPDNVDLDWESKKVADEVIVMLKEAINNKVWER